MSFPRYDSASSALVRMYLGERFGPSPDDVNAYAASAFYAVDRYASYKEDWGAFYEAGGTVLADRWTTSNAVHQCSKLPRAEWDSYLEWLYGFEYGLLGVPEPDLVVWLDMDPEAGAPRGGALRARGRREGHPRGRRGLPGPLPRGRGVLRRARRLGPGGQRPERRAADGRGHTRGSAGAGGMTIDKKIPVTRSSMPSFEEYCEEIRPLWETHWLTNRGVKPQALRERA